MQSARTQPIDGEQQTKEKLIVALDVPTADEARAIIAELSGEVGAFKIGMQLFTSSGSRFVRELVEAGAKIFLDLKFHDIPNTVASAGAEAARLGVWMFNVHAAGGREMMERTVAAVRETVAREGLRQPKIIAVTVLTSANQATLREVGIEREPLAQVVELAKLAAAAGLDGVVASPQEVAAIRENAPKDFLIVTPGIRPAEAKQTEQSAVADDDQKRVMTPGAAVRAGADFLVIGRPILQSDNRSAAVRRILAEIESAAVE